MPLSFWHTQYQETPKGWQAAWVKPHKNKRGKLVPGYWTSFNHWRNCCNTVKKMVGYDAPLKDRLQVVLENQHHDQLLPQPTAARAFQKLDEYLALHQPVMTGVNHTYGAGYNEGTTDHLVAIVGTGTDAKGKYYRFFDVGTIDAHRSKGTDPLNRLYYDSRTKSYSGKSAVNGKTYTISQLRFKPGTF